MSGYRTILRGSPSGPRTYACPHHGVFEELVDLASSHEPRPCPDCGAESGRTLDAALFKPQRGVVVRGKVERSRRPTDLNTEALADGMSAAEFRKRRAAMWHAHDMDEAKRKGLV